MSKTLIGWNEPFAFVFRLRTANSWLVRLASVIGIAAALFLALHFLAPGERPLLLELEICGAADPILVSGASVPSDSAGGRYVRGEKGNEKTRTVGARVVGDRSGDRRANHTPPSAAMLGSARICPGAGCGRWHITLMTTPFGSPTWNRRTPHGSSVNGYRIGYPPSDRLPVGEVHIFHFHAERHGPPGIGGSLTPHDADLGGGIVGRDVGDDPPQVHRRPESEEADVEIPAQVGVRTHDVRDDPPNPHHALQANGQTHLSVLSRLRKMSWLSS